MIELKEWTASEIEEYDDARLELAEDGQIDCTRVYIKADADKVFAELEERIADGDKDFEMANHQNERLLKIVRHQKYKRCLDKAQYWIAVFYQSVDDKHRRSAKKHHYKWLELAEKFKETK